MERIKMPREQRAKQFAPFDALKGLQDALRIKEYERLKIQKGEISEDKANEISSTLLNLEKYDIYEVSYFKEGHILKVTSSVKLNINEQTINIKSNNLKINFDDLVDIKHI